MEHNFLLKSKLDFDETSLRIDKITDQIDKFTIHDKFKISLFTAGDEIYIRLRIYTDEVE